MTYYFSYNYVPAKLIVESRKFIDVERKRVYYINSIKISDNTLDVDDSG